MTGVELNPMLRSTVVEALTEETRGPEGRQSYSQLLSVLERSTTQLFRRLPNVLDRINNFCFKSWTDFNSMIQAAVNSGFVSLTGAVWYLKPVYGLYLTFLYVSLILGTVLIILALLLIIAFEIGVIGVYTAVVLVLTNLHDFLCYVSFKMFSVGLSNKFRQVECFAKRNKFYYEEIKHLKWNWKSFGKVLRHYHSIVLLWFFMFIPILVYECSSHASNSNTIRIHYDLHILADGYYEYIASAVLFLLGFGDWYDLLFKNREDLNILVEPFIPTAKVFNNDFVDNISHLQVADFIEKEGFTFLQTDDQRVKLLLHQFPLSKIRLLMKAQEECVEGDHDAKKVYEMENYLKIQVREGQIMHGDHVVIVQPNSDEIFKYGVIIQSTLIWPWNIPTRQEFNMLWMTKLWVTEMQSRLLRTYIIAFTILYAINELVHCTMIPNDMTWIFVLVFLVTFTGAICGFALLNIFTTFDAHFYDEKHDDVIDLYNNKYIRNANEENFKIRLLTELPNVDADVLRKTMLNVRFAVNYDPYTIARKRFPEQLWNLVTTGSRLQKYGGLRFSDLMHVLERISAVSPRLSMVIRVHLYSYELGEEKIFEVLYYSQLEVLHRAEGAAFKLHQAFIQLLPHIEELKNLLATGQQASPELSAHFLITVSAALALAAASADLLCLAAVHVTANHQDVVAIFNTIDGVVNALKPAAVPAAPAAPVAVQVIEPLAVNCKTALKDASIACHFAADAVFDTSSAAGCNDAYVAVRSISGAFKGSVNELSRSASDALKLVEKLLSTTKSSAVNALAAHAVAIPSLVANSNPVVVNHATMASVYTLLNGLNIDCSASFAAAIPAVQGTVAAGQGFSTLAAIVDVEKHSMKLCTTVLNALAVPCEKVPLSTFVTKILNENQVVARKIIGDIVLQ